MPKKFLSSVIAVAQIICLPSDCEPALAASKDKARDGWRLVQKVDDGAFHVTLTSDAINAYCDRNNYHVIASAPTWTVYVVDEDKKLYAKRTWRQFSTQGLLEFYQRIPLPTTQVKRQGSCVYLGMPSTILFGKYPQNERAVQEEAVSGRFMLADKKHAKAALTGFTYTVTDKLGTAKEINTILRILYGLPAVSDQLPVEYVHLNAAHESAMGLVTKRLEKVKVSDEAFKLHQGLKLVARPIDVVYKADGKQVNEIFEGLGVGTEFGTEKANPAKLPNSSNKPNSTSKHVGADKPHGLPKHP